MLVLVSFMCKVQFTQLNCILLLPPGLAPPSCGRLADVESGAKKTDQPAEELAYDTLTYM